MSSLIGRIHTFLCLHRTSIVWHTLGVVLEFEGWLELPSGLCTVKKSRAPGISLLTRNVFTEAAFSPDFTVEAVISVARSW